MTKDPSKRPSSAEILKMPYVRERMQQFVENTEMDNLLTTGAVFKKQRPTLRRINTKEVPPVDTPKFHPGQEMSTTNSSVPNATVVHMTPKERMAMKKEAEIQARQEEMKMAAAGAKKNYSIANQAKQRDMYEGIMGVPGAAAMQDYNPASV